jgi:hypothetical protein
LRLLSSAGIGLAGLAALIDAGASSGTAPERRATRKKRFKGDPRCKHRKALSLKGVCIGSDPNTVFAAQCTPDCFCVANRPRGARSCVHVTCEQHCAADADCPAAAVCVNTAGCCIDHPDWERTCVTPCPTA